MNIITRVVKNNMRAACILSALLLVLWSWLLQIDAAIISNNVFVGYFIAGFVLLVILAVNLLILNLTARYIKKQTSKSKITNLAILFIVSSVALWLASWLVTVIWYGEGASLDNVLPFTSATPFVVQTPFRYLTRLFGYHGTTALLIVLVYSLYKRSYRRIGVVIFVVVLATNITSYLGYRTPNSQTVTATIVAEKLGDPKQINAQTDLVVLPEYGLDDTDNNNLPLRLKGRQDSYFVGSKQVQSGRGNKNSLLFGTVGLGIGGEHEKSRLIVGGEYLAYTVEPWLRIFSSSTYTNFQVTRSVIRGDDKLKPLNVTDNIVLGAAVCSSIVNTEDYRKLTNDGATILSNSASLEIFSGSSLFAVQHRGLATFMAVANARPFLQSSNNWSAFALDHNGKLLKQTLPTSSAVVDVVQNGKTTPYTVLGEWSVTLGALYMLVSFTIKLKKRFS